MAEGKLIAVEIDEDSLAANGPDAEHERRVAIFDLLEANQFELLKEPRATYKLRLASSDGKLILDIKDEHDQPLHMFGLSLSPFRGVIRDYFMICESYHDAIRGSAPTQIEAIDMARRGIHNEGSELLRERLESKIRLDLDTARRLFTLVCALHSGTKGPIA